MTIVDDYIAAAPEPQRSLLYQMADAIRAIAPEASEKIAYGLATWDLNGNMVHIGSFKDHVSLFPGGVVDQFADDLVGYKTSKGTIQFPLDAPLPMATIEKIVTFRADAQRAKTPRRRTQPRSSEDPR